MFQDMRAKREARMEENLGRKLKGGVVKIISYLSTEVHPSTEMIEKPFFYRTQDLLKAGKVIAACDASVKNGVIGAC